MAIKNVQHNHQETVNDTPNNPSSFNNSNSVSGIFASLGRYSSNTLSSEGTAFMEQLQRQFEIRGKETGDKIEVRSLSVPANSFIVYMTKQGFSPIGLFLFHAEYLPTRLDDIDNCLALKEAQTSLAYEYPDIKVVNSYSVERHDYNSAAQYADTLWKALRSRFDDAVNDFTLQAISQNKHVLVVDSSKEVSDSFLRTFSPGLHRNDFSITVSIAEPGDKYGENYKSICPLVSVAGYIDFNLINAMALPGMPTHQPVIHIGSISAVAEHVNFIPLAVTMAVRDFVNNETYLKPENIKDVVKFFEGVSLNDPRELTTFVRSRLAPPLVVLDAIEMKPKIAGLSEMVESKDNYATDVFNKFFGTNFAGQLFSIYRKQYAGTVEVGNETYDSRVADYLWLSNKFGDRPDIEFALLPYHEREHWAFLTKLVKATPHYYCKSFCINPALISQYIQVLNASVKIFDDTKQGRGMYNMANLQTFQFTPQTAFYAGPNTSMWSY